MLLEKAKKAPLILEGLEKLSGLLILITLIWELGWSGLAYEPFEGSWLIFVREILLFLLALNLGATLWIFWKHRGKLPQSNRAFWVQAICALCALLLLVFAFWDNNYHDIAFINLRRAFCFMVSLSSVASLKAFLLKLLQNETLLNRPAKTPPAFLFLLSLILIILLGTGLLLTPRATVEHISFIDALFLSTSAVCVTGLVPLDISSSLTDYGKVVLLLLFQIGALGVMTFTYFVSLILGQSLTLKERLTMVQLLDEDSLAKIGSFIKSIIALALLVELFGTFFLWLAWKDVPALADSSVLWYAFFHSVSSFCNAGFSLFSDNLASPCIATNRLGQGVVLLLILSGSLGFAVYLELIKRAQIWWQQKKNKKGKSIKAHWTTHIYLVGLMTLILTFGGALILWGISLTGEASSQVWYVGLWESFFYAGARTAGINITDTALFSVPYALVLATLMFIGGNPGSTTGGVHTTVFAVACGEIGRILRSKKEVVFHRRSIARFVVEKSCITVILAGIWVCLMTSILCLIEPQFALQKIVFEIISSFATVGFSLGITPELSTAGKALIITNMIVGRIGMFSFLLALMGNPKPQIIRYPETSLPLS